MLYGERRNTGVIGDAKMPFFLALLGDGTKIPSG